MIAPIVSALSLGLGTVYAGVVLYLRAGWQNLLTPPPATAPFTRVSILIAARNEEENIRKTIDDLLVQNFPEHLREIIIVDDHSTDRTAAIIESYSGRGVKLIRLQEDKPLNSYKKKAISEAIKISSGELMVNTDADCRMGPDWLSSLVSFYEATSYKMISLPVVFFDEKSFFERLQTLEFMYLIGLGASMIGNRNPTTCNGANLAYRKDVFNELNGFQGIDDLASGDDELLLHKVAAKYPDDIGFCRSYPAIVYTHAKPNLNAFMTQRKRWASKTVKYKNKSMIALGIFIWTFNVSLLVNAVSGFYDPVFWKALGCQLVLKLLSELVFLYPVSAFAKRRALLFLLPVLTPVHVIYFIFIGLAGNSGKYAWKGRMVR